MKKDSLIDYWGCIAVRILGPLIRSLPLGLSFFLGVRLGDLFYYLDARHRAVAYSNIRRALGDTVSPCRLRRITRDFYQAYGQNLIEIFLIPAIDQKYIDKHVTFEGLDYIKESIALGQGQIFLGVHAGSWELSSLFSLRLGLAYNIFVRNQRYPRLERLLNFYRTRKGARMIKKESQLRQLIEAFQRNEAVGMSLDQGGKDGILLDFFGKDASFATGAVRMALKYDLPIVPTFNTRTKGPYLRFMIGPVFKVTRSGDTDRDVRENLARLIAIYEGYIRKYPKDYLWSYKVWKYTSSKNILILSDGKTGHLRQSQSLAGITRDYLAQKGLSVNVATQELNFKDPRSAFFFKLGGLFFGKYNCQGCLWCLRNALTSDTYQRLMAHKPDIVISCGASLAGVNYLISRENLAKSLVIMRPSLVSAKKFNLVVVPEHDRPLRSKNAVITEGALNLIDDNYLKQQGEKLKQHLGATELGDFCLGVLLGGDSKGFCLSVSTVAVVIRRVKEAAEKFGADLLVSTSRRTSRQVEELVKKEFQHYPRAKFLVIASQDNPDFAVGGILALSQMLVISPESISMVSEAVKSKKYIVVFEAPGLGTKHRRFLDYFSRKNYIYLTPVSCLAWVVGDVWKEKPKINTLNDNLAVREALKKIL